MRVITFIETLPEKKQPLQNSKTPEKRAWAKQALDELFAMSRPAKHEISLDGHKEAAHAMRRKNINSIEKNHHKRRDARAMKMPKTKNGRNF